MRAAAALIAVAASLGGCAQILGLEDPQGPSSCTPASCDRIAQTGCGANETCNYDPTCSDNYCRSQSGSVIAAGRCDNDTDCVQGLACVYHVCRQFCDPNNSSCGAGTSCAADFKPTVPDVVCSEACNPITNSGCPADFTCSILVTRNAAACLVNNDAIAAGADCSADPFDAAPGCACVNNAWRQQCDSTTTCTTGTCVMTSDFTVEGTQYGVCM